MPNRLVAGLSVLTAAATLTGCGGAGTTTTTTPPGTTTTANTITIKNFAFHPSPLTVKHGQTITVTNQDSSTHTFTTTNKTFDSHGLTQGKTYTFTPTTPGTYTYLCTIHQYMTGTLIVT